jgi:cellulose synthase/poly-beta-1,6-N-acetylglucosamine synthase-like glycosyltransferase
MIAKSPPLSLGLAVRNGRGSVERRIESILPQDFTDFELVVCDNASDDGTIEVREKYARSDSRIRLSANQVNVLSREYEARVQRFSRCLLSLDQRRRLAGAGLSFRVRARTREPPRRHRCDHMVHNPYA